MTLIPTKRPKKINSTGYSDTEYLLASGCLLDKRLKAKQLAVERSTRKAQNLTNLTSVSCRADKCPKLITKRERGGDFD